MEVCKVKQSHVYVAGQGGYHTYRIPSVVVTGAGTVLAFCEGRMFSRADKSPTDLVLRRSLDRGETWEPMQVVVPGVPHAMMDPCPVIDYTTGRIHLVYDRYPEGYAMGTPGLGMDSATTWVTHSDDDGQTWSPPVDITAATKRPEWSEIAHGPGCGIQMCLGRLVVPCNCTDDQGQYWAHTIYSDDGGETWQLGQLTGPKVNESQAVELADDTLLLNMRGERVAGRGTGRRYAVAQHAELSGAGLPGAGDERRWRRDVE